MNEDLKLSDSERTECECWTRVMGYLRPVSQFNHGKKSEFAERTSFLETKMSSSASVKFEDKKVA